MYGCIMGIFAGFSSEGLKQAFFSAVKVPLLLLGTFGISLPSFYVLNMLIGLSRDFRHAVRALVATQAGVSVVLASLAPYTAIWYVSVSDYRAAVLFNASMFAIASLSGQWLLRTYYRPLVEKNSKHRWMMWAWMFVFALVGIQMGWVMRPFIGSPGAPAEFLRSSDWSNAYVVVGRLIWDVFIK